MRLPYLCIPDLEIVEMIIHESMELHPKTYAGIGQKTVGYAITHSAEKTIRYRFTCGNCKKTTAWYYYTFSSDATVEKRGGSIRFTTGDMETVHHQADECTNNKVRKFRKIVDDDSFLDNNGGAASAEPLYPFADGKVCPFCGAKQPWHKEQIPDALGWVAGIGFSCGLFFGLILLALLQNAGIATTWGLFAACVCGSMVACGLLGKLWVGRIRAKKHKAFIREMGNAKDSVMEVDWGDEQ